MLEKVLLRALSAIHWGEGVDWEGVDWEGAADWWVHGVEGAADWWVHGVEGDLKFLFFFLLVSSISSVVSLSLRAFFVSEAIPRTMLALLLSILIAFRRSLLGITYY
jgi:hypothetical protein